MTEWKTALHVRQSAHAHMATEIRIRRGIFKTLTTMISELRGSDEISMEFGFGKCVILHVKHGQTQDGQQNLKLFTNALIQCL